MYYLLILIRHKNPVFYFFDGEKCPGELLENILKHHENKTFPSFKFETKERPPYNACFQHGELHVDDIPEVYRSLEEIKRFIPSDSFRTLTFDFRQHPVYKTLKSTGSVSDLKLCRPSRQASNSVINRKIKFEEFVESTEEGTNLAADRKISSEELNNTEDIWEEGKLNVRGLINMFVFLCLIFVFIHLDFKFFQ